MGRRSLKRAGLLPVVIGITVLVVTVANLSLAVASVPTSGRPLVPPVTAKEVQVLRPTASHSLSRRRDVLQLTSAGLVAGSPYAALAEQAKQFSAGWTAKDGVQFLTYFNEENYGAMRDDTRRTPQFIKAITERVSERKKAEKRVTVLDIGTGPFALFALAAVRAGADKVYAIEANGEAAVRARDFVAEQEDIPEGAVEIIEGFSTAVDLPEKVDLVVAEIMGVIASEENMIQTINDAKERHMKNPKDLNNFIPSQVLTYAAPVSYALHNILKPPRYERLNGQPLRVNARDRTIELLSEPLVLEDIKWTDPKLPGRGGRWEQQPLEFEISASRLETNRQSYYKALKKEEVPDEEAEPLAKKTAESFSGMAFWPKLILDPAGKIVVESRGPAGEHQKSHWPTLLSLMNPEPVPVKAGQKFTLREAADFDGDILGPAKYTLKADLKA